MKKKCILKLLSIISIVAGLCCFTVLLNACGDSPAAQGKNYDVSLVQNKCTELSDTDVLEGIVDENGNDLHIYDYINGVNYGTFSSDKRHSELLYSIIPQELFSNKCEYFHNGYDYSYYIKTEEKDTDGYSYSSEVVIVDNEFDFDEINNIFNAKVNMAVCGKYLTKKQNGELITHYKESVKSKYTLDGVQLYTGLVNENSDYTDENYGSAVISHARLNYNEWKAENAVLDNHMLAVITGSDTELPMFSELFCGVTSSRYIPKNIGGSYLEYGYGNKNTDVEYIFPSKKDQLYSQRYQASGYNFIKLIIAEPRHPVDSAEFITTFSDYSEDFRLVSGLYYYLRVKYSDADEENFCSVRYSRVVNGEQYVATEGKTNGYLLANDSQQIFKFVPDKNGNYVINICEYGSQTLDNSKSILVKLSDGKWFKPSKDGVTMRAGEKWYICVTNVNDSSMYSRYYGLNIQFKPESLQIV